MRKLILLLLSTRDSRKSWTVTKVCIMTKVCADALKPVPARVSKLLGMATDVQLWALVYREKVTCR